MANSAIQPRPFTFQGEQYILNPVDPSLFICVESCQWKKVFAKMLAPVVVTQEILDALWGETRNNNSSFYKAFTRIHNDILTPAPYRK